jgi:hypothetical protein
MKEPPNTGNFSLTSITNYVIPTKIQNLTSGPPTTRHCSAHQDLIINFSNWLPHGLPCILTNKAITLETIFVCATWCIYTCFQVVGASPAVLLSMWLSLWKSFSHPSLVMYYYSLATPPIKLKLDDRKPKPYGSLTVQDHILSNSWRCSLSVGYVMINVDIISTLNIR